MSRPLRLLTISHSYVVDMNRRLAQEMARVGRGRWDVTAVSPSFLHTYLRPVAFEPPAGGKEDCALELLPARFARWIHVMWYDTRLHAILNRGWDAIHCWEEPYVLAGAQVAWGAPKTAALVMRTYQNIPKRYPPPFSWFERYCFDRCAGWEAAGVEILRTMVDRGHGNKPHRFIPDGVDLEAFRPDPAARREVRRGLGLDEDGPPVVGFLARFVPEKGLKVLLAALERTAAPWQALFVGEGVLEGELRGWGRSTGRRVAVVTGVRHGQVPAYLNAMDLLCVPSQTTPAWREQFGRMTVEAFGCGIPVLGSDSGEIPHILRDAGMVVGERDVPAWADALSALLESPGRRREMARLGREKAFLLYAWPVVAKGHLDFFESLLGAVRPA